MFAMTLPLYLTSPIIGTNSIKKSIIDLPGIGVGDIEVAPQIYDGYDPNVNFTKYYFSNLNDNYIPNTIDNCVFTAISMMIGHLDNYVSDYILPSLYESNQTETIIKNKNDLIIGYESPGVGNPIYFQDDNRPMSAQIQEMEDFLVANKDEFLFGLLIDYAKDLGLEFYENFGVDEVLSTQYGDDEEIINEDTHTKGIIEKYIDNNSYLKDYATLNLVTDRNDAINELKKGNPVLVVGIVRDNGNAHAAVAAYYNESINTIYGNLGHNIKGLTDFDDYFSKCYHYYYLEFSDTAKHQHANHCYDETSDKMLCSCQLSSHSHIYKYETIQHNAAEYHYYKCKCKDHVTKEKHQFTISSKIGIKEYASCIKCRYTIDISESPIPIVIYSKEEEVEL